MFDSGGTTEKSVDFSPPTSPRRRPVGRHIGGLDPSANLAGNGDSEKALVDEWLKFASSMQVGKRQTTKRQSAEGEGGGGRMGAETCDRFGEKKQDGTEASSLLLNLPPMGV